MNRVILVRDTGSEAVDKALECFVRYGDTVYLAARRTVNIPGVQVLDPATAAEEIQKRSGKLDILIIGVPKYDQDGLIGSGHDYEEMLDYITDCAQSNLNLIENCLPLLRKGMKRIACITDNGSSNSWSVGRKGLALHQALAGQNMMGKILFNRLRPEGFTFRWFCDDGIPGGMSAAEYIISNLCYDEKEPYIHSDENRFVMRDCFLREISW